MGRADARVGAADIRMIKRGLAGAALLVALTGGVSAAAGQATSLNLDPGQTSVSFTLADVLHTVQGTFHLKHGELRFEPSSGKISGEIVVDARSGKSGSGLRDRKMHKEVLESEWYPDISFRPDRIEGKVAAAGKSSVQVHGIFRIHGIERELTVPADVEISGDHWNVAVHFAIPYAQWGMKNPSTLFLRVSDSVEIDLTGSGTASHVSSSASISGQSAARQ